MNGIQYVTDSKGKPMFVQLPIKAYEKLLEDAEMKADIAAYRKAKRNQGEMVPLEKAFEDVEAHWKQQK